jgi:hypothetical protein
MRASDCSETEASLSILTGLPMPLGGPFAFQGLTVAAVAPRRGRIHVSRKSLGLTGHSEGVRRVCQRNGRPTGHFAVRSGAERQG